MIGDWRRNTGSAGGGHWSGEAVSQDSLGRSPISANLFGAITAGVCLAGVRAIARGAITAGVCLAGVRAIARGIGDVLVGRPNWRRSGSNE